MGIPEGGIAFFDSGIGGLTVLKECRKRLPEELFYYYGDNRHAPYGNLPPEEIFRYVLHAFHTFERLRIRAAVVGCNTVTALCVEELRKRFAFPIVGAEPAIREAAHCGGDVLVLTTRATHESERFKRLCEKLAREFPATTFFPVPCDSLAGTIEKRIGEKDFDFTSLLPRGSPVAVVLGCTHYIYIKEQIADFYHCPVFDGNAGMAKRLVSVLDREGRPLLSPKTGKDRKKRIFFLGSGKKINEKFFTSGHEQMFV